MDVRSLWDFSDPDGTRAKFEDLALKTEDADERFILKTQIARTYSFKNEIADSHKTLDNIEGELQFRSDEAKSYYLLERGRVFNSDDKKQEAMPFFEKAAALRIPGLWLDALHMIAVAQDSPEKSEEKNRQALAEAEFSNEPADQSWKGTILNNLGWDLHSQDRFDEALTAFQRAQEEREKAGNQGRINIARWCVARCLRSLERYEEALAIQKELKQLEPDDKFVDEEIAELEKVMA